MKQFNITSELETKIINAAYGDADVLITIHVYFLRKKHSSVNDLYLMYKKTAREIHQIGPDECPEQLVDNALRQADRIKPEEKNKTLTFLQALFMRPVTPVITVVAIIILLITFLPISYQTQFTDDEIRLADKQVKQTLQIIGNVFNRTSKKVRNTILADKVADPIYEGITIIDDIFKEKENEKVN